MTENKYQKGKIYTIRSSQTDKYYIGSTCNKLYKRLGQHKQNYKNYVGGTYHFVSSFDIVKFDDCYIELLEDFKCDNKEQLNKREGELIRQLKNDIVNKVIAGRTKKEWENDNKDKLKAQFKNYYENNKDEKLKSFKKYYENNKEYLTNYNKSYYEKNKEKILEKVKAYRDTNKEKLKKLRQISRLEKKI